MLRWYFNEPTYLFTAVIGSLSAVFIGFAIIHSDSFVVDTNFLVIGYSLICFGFGYPLLTIWIIMMPQPPSENKPQLEVNKDGRISIPLGIVDSLKDNSDK